MSDDLSRIQNGDGSKFNSAMADLERIHNCLVIATQARLAGDLKVWCEALLNLESELDCYLNDAERKEVDAVRVQTVITNNVHIRAQMKFMLIRFEKVLRRLRAKKNLGIVANDNTNLSILE